MGLSSGSGQNGYLDYARGLGIAAVVFGHINPGFGPSVGTFHMPLFFFIGGIALVRGRPWPQVARFVLKDMLLFAILMMLGYTLVAAALEPLGLHMRSYTDFGIERFTTDILVHTSHHVGFALTAWFLVAYAGATIVAQALVAVLPERRIALTSTALALALLTVGILIVAPAFHDTNAWYFNLAAQVNVGTGFMLLGFAFRRAGWERHLDVTLLSVVGLFVFVTLVRTLGARDIGMVFSSYDSGPVVGVLCALAGIIATLQLAMLMNRGTAWWWMGSIGRYSKHVMAHHLFVFTLVNLGFAVLGLAAFTDIESVYTKFYFPASWLLYLVPGVLVSWGIGVVLRWIPRALRSWGKPAGAKPGGSVAI